VRKGDLVDITATIGKQVAHPNTTEHHIRWIRVYFLPRGETYPYQIGNFEFTAHGESTKGPDTSTIYTYHGIACKMKTEKPGTIYATSYCNIHGLWENSKELNVEGSIT
jgi:superoxide reductase